MDWLGLHLILPIVKQREEVFLFSLVSLFGNASCEVAVISINPKDYVYSLLFAQDSTLLFWEAGPVITTHHLRINIEGRVERLSRGRTGTGLKRRQMAQVYGAESLAFSFSLASISQCWALFSSIYYIFFACLLCVRTCVECKKSTT